jgi:hypothetical protein
MDLSTFTKDCARRFSNLVLSLQKQAPSAKMIGKFAVDQAVKEARKVVTKPMPQDDSSHD